MDKAEISQSIVKDLTEARDPDDIIFDICEKYRLSWKDAKTLVSQKQDENRDEITLRQAPLLTTFALVTFISGLVLLAYGIYQLFFIGNAVIHFSHLESIQISEPFFLPVNMIINTGLDPFTLIIFGSALVLGSLIGMRDIWAVILSKLNIGRP